MNNKLKYFKESIDEVQALLSANKNYILNEDRSFDQVLKEMKEWAERLINASKTLEYYIDRYKNDIPSEKYLDLELSITPIDHPIVREFFKPKNMGYKKGGDQVINSYWAIPVSQIIDNRMPLPLGLAVDILNMAADCIRWSGARARGVRGRDIGTYTLPLDTLDHNPVSFFDKNYADIETDRKN